MAMTVGIKRNMRIRSSVGIWTVILILVPVSLACRGWVRDSEYSRKEPKRVDLVGNWIPDPATLKEMRTKGGYETSVEPKLVLRDDGSFDLSNMPDWWNNGEGKSSARFDKYSGTWSVSQGHTGLWQLVLYSTKGIRPVDMLGQSPPYRLSFTIGDPDDQLWMVFIRQ